MSVPAVACSAGLHGVGDSLRAAGGKRDGRVVAICASYDGLSAGVELMTSSLGNY